MQAGLLFFIAVFWGFFPVFTAIFTFPQERAMLSKERAADMYRLSAYFVARTTSDLPLDLILPVLFLVVVYFMAGLRMDVASFFLTIVTVFLCIIAAQVCPSPFTHHSTIGVHFSCNLRTISPLIASAKLRIWWTNIAIFNHKNPT